MIEKGKMRMSEENNYGKVKVLNKIGVGDYRHFGSFMNEFGEEFLEVYEDIKHLNERRKGINEKDYKVTMYERLENEVFLITEYKEGINTRKQKRELDFLFYFEVTNGNGNVVLTTKNATHALRTNEKINAGQYKYNKLVVVERVDRDYIFKMVTLEVWVDGEKVDEIGKFKERKEVAKQIEIIRDRFKGEYRVFALTKRGMYNVYINGKFDDTFHIEDDALSYTHLLQETLPTDYHIELYERRKGGYGKNNYKRKREKFKGVLDK